MRIFYGGLRRSKRFRRICRGNLILCYPHLSQTDLDQFIDRTAFECARSLVETFKVWAPKTPAQLHDISVEYHGLDHFNAALAQDRGIILLGCHFGSLDLKGYFTHQLKRGGRKLICVYKQPSNPHIDAVLRGCRAHLADRFVPIHHVRTIVSELKAGNVVWLVPDLEAKGPGAVFVDFFGVAASTTTWPSRIAAMTNAIVLPTSHIRLSDAPEYRYEIFPNFDDFPSGDDVADARRFNAYVENVIAHKPEMYWWCIKRFKHRPKP